MANERNALEELAERLDPRNYHRNDFLIAVERAKRIIAELAKVQAIECILSEENKDLPVNVEMGIIHSYQTNCITRCRAIAEERA